MKEDLNILQTDILDSIISVNGTCPYCKKYFLQRSIKQFSNHIHMCPHNKQKKMCASCSNFQLVGPQNEYTVCRQDRYKNITYKSIKPCWTSNV